MIELLIVLAVLYILSKVIIVVHASIWFILILLAAAIFYIKGFTKRK
jgi:hypothetical protein